MTVLFCLLNFVSSPAMAELPKLTVRQQAEIITVIDQAKHELDGTKDKWGYRNLVYGPALETKIELEKAMGMRDDKGKLLDWRHSEPTEEELNKISNGWRFWDTDRRKEYQKAVWIVEAAKKRSEERYQQALDLTFNYSRIGPKGEAGFPVNGPPWDRKKWLAWSPAVSTVPEPHEEGSETDVQKAFEEQPAFIRGTDAAVVFRPSAFFDNLTGQPLPGKVARLLFHETMHVNDYRTPEAERDIRNMPAMEVKHRLVDLYFGVEAFEISPNGWKGLLMDAIANHDLARQWALYIAAGYDPYNESQRNEIFMKLEVSDGRKKQIEVEVEHDARLFSDAGKEMGGDGKIESLESLRDQTQSSFLKSLNDESLAGLIKGWNKARELEAGKQQKELEILYARADIEAERCGFKRYILPGQTLPRSFRQYRTIQGRTCFDEYWSRSQLGLEDLKIVLMLARACIEADPHYALGWPDEACNEGMDLINRNWGEAALREKADVMGSSANADGCLQYVREHLSLPASYEGLKASIEASRKQLSGGGGSPGRGGSGGGNNGGGGGSDRDRSGGGVGDGDGPTRRKGEDIQRGGKWPQ